MILGTTEVRSNNQQQEVQILPQESQQRYSTWIPSIARVINRIAVPAVALMSLSCLPGASAGPLAYAACVSGCELSFELGGIAMAPATAGWSFLSIIAGPLTCPLLCGPALAAPSP